MRMNRIGIDLWDTKIQPGFILCAIKRDFSLKKIKKNKKKKRKEKEKKACLVYIYIFFSSQILYNSCPSAEDVLGRRHNTAVPFVCSETRLAMLRYSQKITKNKAQRQRLIAPVCITS